MSKKSPLENLLEKSGLNQYRFAERVGNSTSCVNAQLSNPNKSLHPHLASVYGKKLGLLPIDGYINDVYITIGTEKQTDINEIEVVTSPVFDEFKTGTPPRNGYYYAKRGSRFWRMRFEDGVWLTNTGKQINVKEWKEIC